MFGSLHKKQNGKEVVINSDDVSSLQKSQTTEDGTHIAIRNGDKHEVSEQLEEVKKTLGIS